MSDNKVYDLVIIGGGPGGYVCAIRAAQLGFKTAVVEKRDALGGTCLNVGCIPSKALLTASEKYHAANESLGAFGVKTKNVKLDLKKMMAFKDKVVADNTGGINYLFKKNNITWIEGTGSIPEAGTVKVQLSGQKNKTQTLEADNIVIATGSEVISLPDIEIDEKQILSSTGALAIEDLPESLLVVGGGYIGLEMGVVWKRLGTKVTVVEFMDTILPAMDGDLSKEMKKILTNDGLDFRLKSKVTGIKKNKKSVTVTVEPADGGDAETINVEKVLVAIGRRPFTKGLGLEDLGVEMDDKGRIKVDGTFETSVEGIFALGDVIAGPMLAHKAEEDGVALAELLAGEAGHVDYDIIPAVVYTEPEIATIGRTEEQLKEDGVAYNVGKFPYKANGRARSMNLTNGFVKILADKKTDKILGAHIIGHEAGGLIHEIAIVMAFEGSAEDLARTCHAHPTLNESVKEAALAVAGRPIHI